MHKDLIETCRLMGSVDYKDRFIAEYIQVSIRYGRLQNMVEEWDKGELPYTPICPRSTYDLQLRVMADYIAVLEARAVMEGIDLGK